MRSKALALILAIGMALSTVAMAADSDERFVFGKEQVASTPLSAAEMQATDGKIIGGVNPIIINLGIASIVIIIR